MNTKDSKVQFTHNIKKDALQALWEICFPEDGAGFAQFFLERYYASSQAICVVGEDGKTPESALYWLPCTYTCGNANGTFLYIYAMGTHPDYRKKGNLRRMLEFMEAYCLAHGIDGILLHAMHTSKSSVEKFGMKPLLSLNKVVSTVSNPQGEWCEGTYEDFQMLRGRYLESLPAHISWHDRELHFVYDDLCRDGKLFFFAEEDGLHYGIVSRGDQGFCIEETDCEKGLMQRLTGSVCVYRPGQGIYAAHVKSYNKSLQEQNLCKLYFNLMLK